MDDLITARYYLTEQDYFDVCVAHHRYLWRSSPILRFSRVLFMGIIALGLAAWLASRVVLAMHPSSVLLDIAVPLLMLVSLAYLFRPTNFLNRLWFNYNFRSIHEGSRSIEWGFDRDVLWSRTPLSEGNYRWELFPTIVETPKCFLFYQGPFRMALWLPAHGFASPGMLRIFADLARTKVPNYVVLGECQFPAKPEPIFLDEF